MEPSPPAQTRNLFLRAAWGENTAQAPIWLMRQAGRYLPEYMAIKAHSSFWEMVRTPELAAEITLQPLRRFDLDAAILFSDIMTPLPAMGMEIEFSPGPVLPNPLRSAKAIEQLVVPAKNEMAPFVAQTIGLLRPELDAMGKTLIGFGGAPLTLATYAIQGSGSKDFEAFRAFLHQEPQAAHRLLEKLTQTTIAYLQMQVEAGAEAIQLFDSWAGLHSPSIYRQFALPYITQVFKALEGYRIPRIYLAVGASHLYSVIKDLECEVVSVDWRTDLSQLKAVFNHHALQGNLDPTVLLTNPQTIYNEATQVLEAGLGKAHIFNLGHGLLRQTPPDHVARLVDWVHSYNRLS